METPERRPDPPGLWPVVWIAIILLVPVALSTLKFRGRRFPARDGLSSIAFWNRRCECGSWLDSDARRANLDCAPGRAIGAAWPWAP